MTKSIEQNSRTTTKMNKNCKAKPTKVPFTVDCVKHEQRMNENVRRNPKQWLKIEQPIEVSEKSCHVKMNLMKARFSRCNERRVNNLWWEICMLSTYYS